MHKIDQKEIYCKYYTMCCNIYKTNLKVFIVMPTRRFSFEFCFTSNGRINQTKVYGRFE